MAEKGSSTLAGAVARLREFYGAPEKPPTSDPFELVLLENVAYLTSPARRREAFEELRLSVGTSPAALLAASRTALEKITARGILRAGAAAKLRDCARIAVEKFGGDLDAALSGPIDRSRRALRSFPGIGEPGADKVLLFSGRAKGLAPESNGLRVLVRLGFVREEKSYAKTYAASRAAAAALAPRVPAIQAAHLILQHHGRTLCRRSDPLCDRCPLARGCAHALRLAGGAAPRVRSPRR